MGCFELGGTGLDEEGIMNGALPAAAALPDPNSGVLNTGGLIGGASGAMDDGGELSVLCLKVPLALFSELLAELLE